MVHRRALDTPQGVWAPPESRGECAPTSRGIPRWRAGTVNGFHVHAVGWLLVANPRAFRPPEAREVAALWEALVRARAEDLRRAHPLCRLLFPRSLPLAPPTLAALMALVERLATQHPERFSGDALRRRRDHWAFQVALGFLFSVLAATVMPKTWPLADTVAPTFFLMACGCLLPALTLWRAAAAVHYCHTHHPVPWNSPQNPSDITQTHARA